MREDIKIKILQNMLDEVTKEYDYFIAQKEIMLQRTFEKSIKDSLTNFYNKAYMYDYLKQLYKRAKREGFKFVLIFIDVDNFKHVNDTYGHTKGDELLKKVAEIIKNSFRDYDTFVRYGGDEFIVILELRNDFSMENIKVLLEKLQKRIENRFKKYNISISYGMAINTEVDNIDKLIEFADMKMYKMKQEHHLKNT